MKKKLLTIVLALGCIFAASTTSYAEDDASFEWTVVQEVDDFGDPIDTDSHKIAIPIQGDFSNTATQNSDLTGFVYVEYDFDPFTINYTMEFSLLEYGNTNAVYASADQLILKTKTSEGIKEYQLSGEAPNRDLYLAKGFPGEAGKISCFPSGNEVVSALFKGEDVRCIIEIGSSKYNFTILNSNFGEISKEQGFISPSSESVAKRLVFISDLFLRQNFSYSVWYNYFLGLSDMKFPYDSIPMTSSEIEEKIQGDFIGIGACVDLINNKIDYKTQFVRYDLISFDGENKTHKGGLANGKPFESLPADNRVYLDGLGSIEYVDNNSSTTYYVSEDKMYINSIDKLACKFYEIHEGIYICEYDSIDSITDSSIRSMNDYLLIKYDGEHSADAIMDYIEGIRFIE